MRIAHEVIQHAPQRDSETGDEFLERSLKELKKETGSEPFAAVIMSEASEEIRAAQRGPSRLELEAKRVQNVQAKKALTPTPSTSGPRSAGPLTTPHPQARKILEPVTRLGGLTSSKHAETPNQSTGPKPRLISEVSPAIAYRNESANACMSATIRTALLR
jgi:hypothetical protein